MDSNIKHANSKISQELTKRQCREHKINKTCSNYCTFFVSRGLFPNVKPFLLSNHFISTNFSSNCSRSNWKIKGNFSLHKYVHDKSWAKKTQKWRKASDVISTWSSHILDPKHQLSNNSGSIPLLHTGTTHYHLFIKILLRGNQYYSLTNC